MTRPAGPMDSADPATAAAVPPAARAELPGLRDWLRAFEAQRGRPLRVLHVGNIANNAYLNAKFLRAAGVDAHVLSHDYDDVMATPEWEEIDPRPNAGENFPAFFSKSELGEYRRPDWFCGSPLKDCAARLASLRHANLSLFRRMSFALSEGLVAGLTSIFGARTTDFLRLVATDPRLFLMKTFRRLLSGPARSGRMPAGVVGIAGRLNHAVEQADALAAGAGERAPLIAEFDRLFPRRHDRLKAGEIADYQEFTKYFRPLFRHYDVVQCYSTDPLHALLAGTRPYVAFEHGTLRDFTMGDAALHRLTALAYRQADHVFITNGDCLAYAEKLGIADFSPIVHPVDVDQHRRDFGDDVQRLRRALDADVVLFCPVRHDWEIKGVDVHLRALPLIKARVAGRLKLLLVRWGQQLRDSERLIEELGCSDDVIWREPLCRIPMIKYIRASDVVLDQMILGVLGGITPQALACGKPVVARYESEKADWLFPEPPPVLPVFSPDDIAAAVVRALDPAWLAEFAKRARHWIDAYHHPDNIVRDHLKVYRKLLDDRQSRQGIV